MSESICAAKPCISLLFVQWFTFSPTVHHATLCGLKEVSLTQVDPISPLLVMWGHDNLSYAFKQNLSLSFFFFFSTTEHKLLSENLLWFCFASGQRVMQKSVSLPESESMNFFTAVHRTDWSLTSSMLRADWSQTQNRHHHIKGRDFHWLNVAGWLQDKTIEFKKTVNLYVQNPRTLNGIFVTTL